MSFGSRKRQQALVARYVDGEMTGEERERFQARLVQEPSLQARVSELESLRSWFRGGRDEPLVPASPGFGASVLAAARRLPTRDELLQQDARSRESELVTWSRRVTLAAALVFGVSMLVFMTLRLSGPTVLQANENLLQQKMEALDQAIREKEQGR